MPSNQYPGLIEKYTEIIARILRYHPDSWHPKTSGYIRDRLDEIASITVRIRDDFRCRLCGKTYPEVTPTCGHVITRSCYPTRWLESNLFCQCQNENFEQEMHPEKYRLLWTPLVGGTKKYDALVRLAYQTEKIEKSEKIQLFHYWRARLVTELQKRGFHEMAGD